MSWAAKSCGHPSGSKKKAGALEAALFHSTPTASFNLIPNASLPDALPPSLPPSFCSFLPSTKSSVPTVSQASCQALGAWQTGSHPYEAPRFTGGGRQAPKAHATAHSESLGKGNHGKGPLWSSQRSLLQGSDLQTEL